MANILDKTLFVGDLYLPKDSFSNIDLFITKFEKVVLINLLGYEEYKKLIATPTLEPYKSLIDGAEFTVQSNGVSETLKWDGLKQLIACYVYCYYMKNSVSSTQSVGETKSIQENSGNANIFGKVLSAWTQFENLYGSEYENLEPTAYAYIYSKKDLFPKWRFTELTGSINSHDL